MKDKEIYDVMSYLHPVEVENMAIEDERPGIWATRLKRAAKEYYLGLNEQDKKNVMDTVESWKAKGYPAVLQDK